MTASRIVRHTLRRIDWRAFSLLPLALTWILAVSPLRAGGDDEPLAAEAPRSGAIVEIKLSGIVADRVDAALLGPAMTTVEDLRDVFYRSAADPNVKAVVLKLETPVLGLAKAQQLGRFADRVRESGKPVYAHFDLATIGSYVLAISASEVAMSPSRSALLAIPGIRMEVAFYKGLFDWLGIEADTIQVGDFKGLAEPYSRQSMSPELRREMETLADSLFDVIVQAIAQRRSGLTPVAVKSLIDKGLFQPADAQQAGLVDTLASYREFVEILETRHNATLVTDYAVNGGPSIDLSNPFTLLANLFGPPPTPPATLNPKIAIIYLSGMIVPQEVLGVFDSGGVIAPARTLAALKTAAEDDTVKGIVLRIDSPGGSALASEQIWQAVREIDRDKPVIASLSDMAASGGYYLAVGARHIVAEPSAITGSIGVAGGKLSMRELYDKLGITKETISRGQLSGLFSDYQAWTPAEKLAMTRMMAGVYAEFLDRVNAGRPNLEMAAVRRLAQGRVFTGVQAFEHGLVDELGGLASAVSVAKREAARLDDALDAGQPMDIMVLPRPRNPLQTLLGSGDDMASIGPQPWSTAVALMPGAQEHLARMAAMSQLLQRERALTVLPFVLTVE